MSGKNDSNNTPKPGAPAETPEAEGGTEREAPAAGVAGGPMAPNLNPDELARAQAADEGMEPPFSEETDAPEEPQPERDAHAAGFVGGPAASNLNQEELARDRASGEGMEPPYSEEAATGADSGPAADAAAPGKSPFGEEPAEDPHRALQRAILDAALPHIAFDGWTRAVLDHAAEEAGFHEGDVDLAFPGGPAEAVLTHAALADDDMALEMQTLDLDSMRTRDKISIAVRVRLESQIANREAIRRGLRLLAGPRHAPEAAKSLARTVDSIWRIAGDTSTDFNYYSKRGLLAGVYSATLVYWLQDNSEDQHRTWEFLTRRIDEVLRFGKATSGMGKIVDRLPNPFRLCSGGRRRWREGPVHR